MRDELRSDRAWHIECERALQEVSMKRDVLSSTGSGSRVVIASVVLAACSSDIVDEQTAALEEDAVHAITGVISHNRSAPCCGGVATTTDQQPRTNPYYAGGDLAYRATQPIAYMPPPDLEIVSLKNYKDSLDTKVEVAIEAQVMGLTAKSKGTIGVSLKGQGCIEVSTGDAKKSVFQPKDGSPFVADAKVSWSYAITTEWAKSMSIAVGVGYETPPVLLYKVKGGVETEINRAQASEVGIKLKNAKEVTIADIAKHFKRDDIYFEDLQTYVRHRLEEEKPTLDKTLRQPFENNAFQWRYQHDFTFTEFTGKGAPSRKNEDGTAVYDAAWCKSRRYRWKSTTLATGRYELADEGDVVLFKMPDKDPVVREYEHGVGNWTKYEWYACVRVELDAAKTSSVYTHARGTTVAGLAIREQRDGKWRP